MIVYAGIETNDVPEAADGLPVAGRTIGSTGIWMSKWSCVARKPKNVLQKGFLEKWRD